MKKIAVILAGCGILDGSEIHESTCSLLAMQQQGCEYTCFSLNKNQTIVFNHSTKEEIQETRNMLAESARIARLKINDIKTLNVNDFDILYIPGGRGVCYNLCSFFIANENYTVELEVKNVINEFFRQKKPICALCLAPVVVNKALEGKNIKLTVGNDKEIANLINKMNNKHIDTEPNNICVDEENKILTSPCYMLTKEIVVVYNEAFAIIQKAIELSNG